MYTNKCILPVLHELLRPGLHPLYDLLREMKKKVSNQNSSHHAVIFKHAVIVY